MKDNIVLTRDIRKSYQRISHFCKTDWFQQGCRVQNKNTIHYACDWNKQDYQNIIKSAIKEFSRFYPYTEDCPKLKTPKIVI